MISLVGSHQATLKELSRVRHELLKARSQEQRPKLEEKETCTASTPQVHLNQPQFMSMVFATYNMKWYS